MKLLSWLLLSVIWLSFSFSCLRKFQPLTVAIFGRLQLMDKCNLQFFDEPLHLFHMEASLLQEKTPRVLLVQTGAHGLLIQNNNFSTEAHVSTPQYGSTLRMRTTISPVAVAAMDSCFVLKHGCPGLPLLG